MREIVTLQIGNQSNYVGTHFWNTQESYFTYGGGVDGEEESPINHDIHFRPGLAPDGTETFTPRTIIYDFKQAFGTLRRINELYEVLEGDNQANIWGGATVTQSQPTIPYNEYQRQLNAGSTDLPQLSTDNVRFWSDFNKVYYHPRSIVQVYESELNPNQRSFDIWAEGEELFQNLDKEHDLLDRDLRPFMEECDQLQGFQILIESGTAWGAFAARYIDRIKDEYDRKTLWVYNLDDGVERIAVKRASKLTNEARALHEILPHSSIYVPVKLTSPGPASLSTLHRSSRWHTSAPQVAAIETLTLPSRLRSATRGNTRTATLDELASLVCGGIESRKIGRLSLDVADEDADADMNGQDERSSNSGGQQKGWDLSPLNEFSGDRSARARNSGNSCTFHEVVVSRGEDIQQPLNGFSEHQDEREDRKVQSFQTALCFPLLDSFPRVYKIKDKSKLSAQAQLSTHSSTAHWVTELDRFVRPRIPLEERADLSDGLQEIADSYVVGYDGSEDDMDDDD